MFCNGNRSVIVRRKHEGIKKILQVKNFPCICIKLAWFNGSCIGRKGYFFIQFTVFQCKDTGHDLGCTGVCMAYIFVFGIYNFSGVRINEKGTVGRKIVIETGMFQGSVCIKIIIGFLDPVFSGDCLSVFAEIIGCTGFICDPSGDHCTVFAYIVVVIFITDQSVFNQVALRSGTEIILFSVISVPAAPAMTKVIKTICFIVDLQKDIFGKRFVFVLIFPEITIRDEFSGSSFFRLLKSRRSIDC